MRKNGFTLVEITVVTLIIIMLTIIIVPSYNTSRKQFALQRSASKLAQDIRRAQEMTMSAKDFPEHGGTISKGGYGIYIRMEDPEKYILFADCNGNCSYDAAQGAAANCFSSQGNTIYGSCTVGEVGVNIYPEKFGIDIAFEGGVRLDSVSPPSPLNITFTPPNPVTWVNGGDTGSTTIVLRNDDITLTVKVLPTGLIYVE